MSEEKETWGDYSKLVLKELERLNDNYDKLRGDLDHKFQDLNTRLTEVKSVETSVKRQNEWMEKVNDVWSPIQMKEAKDEIYNQKNRWVAAIAIISFIQILIGVGIAVWAHFK